MEKYVCNLKHSTKLKELGVKQESYWFWVIFDNGDTYLRVRWEAEQYKRQHGDDVKIYAAPCVGELGEMLPVFIQEKGKIPIYLNQMKDSKEFYLDFQYPDKEYAVAVKADTEANARAAMLESLIENKLMEV